MGVCVNLSCGLQNHMPPQPNMEINTNKSPVPSMLEPVVEKLPPNVQEHVKAIIGKFTADQCVSRGHAIALSTLQIWAIAASPYIALLAALLVTLDPQMCAKHLETADSYRHQLTKSVPSAYLLPAAVASIFLLTILSWLSSMAGWITMIVWMALAAAFAADVVVTNWKKEQKHAKGADPPLVSPGGSTHEQ